MTVKQFGRKIIILILLMFLAAGVYLTAADGAEPAAGPAAEPGLETVRLRIETLSGEVEAYRYQLNGEAAGGWTTVALEEPLAVFETTEKHTDVMYLQYSQDGRRWSRSLMIVHDEETDQWVLLREKASAYSDASGAGSREPVVRISLGGKYRRLLNNLPDSICRECIGGELQIARTLTGDSGMLAFGELSVVTSEAASSALQRLYEVSLGAGAGYRLQLGAANPGAANLGAVKPGTLGLTPEAAGGVIVHLPIDSEGRLLKLFADGYAEAGLRASVRVAAGWEVYMRGGVKLYLEDGAFGLMGTAAAGLTALR